MVHIKIQCNIIDTSAPLQDTHIWRVYETMMESRTCLKGWILATQPRSNGKSSIVLPICTSQDITKKDQPEMKPLIEIHAHISFAAIILSRDILRAGLFKYESPPSHYQLAHWQPTTQVLHQCLLGKEEDHNWVRKRRLGEGRNPTD